MLKNIIRKILNTYRQLLNLENCSGVLSISSMAPDFLSGECFADVDYQEELRKYEEYKRCKNG